MSYLDSHFDQLGLSEIDPETKAAIAKDPMNADKVLLNKLKPTQPPCEIDCQQNKQLAEMKVKPRAMEGDQENAENMLKQIASQNNINDDAAAYQQFVIKLMGDKSRVERKDLGETMPAKINEQIEKEEDRLSKVQDVQRDIMGRVSVINMETKDTFAQESRNVKALETFISEDIDRLSKLRQNEGEQLFHEITTWSEREGPN